MLATATDAKHGNVTANLKKRKMNDLEKEVNRVWDIAVYLQMMAAFSEDLDFNKYGELMLELHNTVKEEGEEEVEKKLPKYEKKLLSIAKPLKSKYPLRRTISEIAKDWNEKHKINKEIFSDGVMIGWLEEQIDLKSYKYYDYYPYHFKVGLVIHKSRGEIEEHFLLKDAFTCLIKAKNRLKTLDKFGKAQKERFKSSGRTQFDKETLNSINAIKYEVAFYSRMTIISFFSFLESFVNSIGFDHYFRNKGKLSNEDEEILQGSEKGRFLNLKYKIEKFQKIIRSDNVAKIILSDDNQTKEPFKTLFEDYEGLRNASVHFSPKKVRIWLKPHDWENKAEEFSKLVVQAALEIWRSCHETNKGPDYLGKLEYKRLFKIANDQENEIREIENWL